MSDSQDSRVGTMFGPYHLKRLLGRGGMGEVYEADHTVKEWTVAVKLLSETFSKDPVFRERMKREARIAGRLQEPHVVPIHDYGEIDGQLFLEMRLIEGIDLDSVLKRFGPLTPPRAVAIISQVASALDAAHAAGVMHRDVKPPNILITRDDFAYLVDFGIASATTDEKLTQLGTAVGTWKYMAPERFSSEEVTYRADIYALGCVLYECLTGAPPYRADSASVLVTAHLMDPVPQASAKRAGIPKSFDAVIAHAMAKKPEDRYASAGDLALAAHDALSNPDQDHASDILRRSREATLQGPASANPLPTMAGTGVVPPQPAPPTMAASNFTAPQPPTVQQTPPPYTAQPTWAPDSGPMPAQGQPAPNQPIHNQPIPSQPIPSQQYYPQGTGNWGNQPPGPPQQPTGPTSWNQPQHQPLQPAKRNPWPIIAGAAALVLVLVVAAIGIWAVMKPDNTPVATTTPTPPPITTTTTQSSTAPSAGALNTLLSLLPAGYPAGACKQATPKPDSIWLHSLAMVSCGQNTNAGGPTRAIYGLFADADAVKQAFTDDIAAVQLANCPGEGPSPDGWHLSKDPNVTVGQIACGTYKNQPNLIWSNEQKLTLSDVFGDSPITIDDLHTWWGKYG